MEEERRSSGGVEDRKLFSCVALCWFWEEWCDNATVGCGTLGGGGAATAGGIDWRVAIGGKLKPGECCDCVGALGSAWDVTDDGDTGGDAIKWLGECKSGDPMLKGGLICIIGGRGTAVIFANSDWNDVEGEYIGGIPGGNIWGGVLFISTREKNKKIYTKEE